MKKEDITSLANAYGWESISSNNRVMLSFKRDDWRMNFYYTTGTVTFQSTSGESKSIKDVVTDELFETILINQV